MSKKPTIGFIDGVNYVRKTIPTAEGPKQLEGITVRAAVRLLQSADQDAMLLYLAEQPGGLIFGCIAGAASVGSDDDSNMIVFFGPEAAVAIKQYGFEQLGGSQ